MGCPGHLPDPGMNRSLSWIAGGFFTTGPPGKPRCLWFLICFFKEQASFNFVAVVTVQSDFRAQGNKICTFSPICLSWGDGIRCHDLPFLNVKLFKPGYSLSSSTFIQRLFSFSLLSAIRVVLSAYLRLLIFLLAVLIPASESSSLASCMIYFQEELVKDPAS